MKYVFSVALILSSVFAQATNSLSTRAYIVVKDSESEDFFVERVPLIGCVGVSYGPQLAQFTAPYMASANIGCGGGQQFENINYLTCAKITEMKSNATASELQGLSIDLSACQDKDNAQLITMIRTAAKLNFPLPGKTKEIQLKIIK